MDIICAYSDSDGEGEKTYRHHVNLNSSCFVQRVPINHGKDDVSRSDIKKKEEKDSLKCTPRDPFDSHTSETEQVGQAEEVKTRHTEDPHQGRIRSFPHVEGQFATHVYMEIDPPRDRKTVKLLGRIKERWAKVKARLLRVLAIALSASCTYLGATR